MFSPSYNRQPCLFQAPLHWPQLFSHVASHSFQAVTTVTSPELAVLSRRMRMAELWRCDFEVFGRVQGVFFRKYTQGKAQELGVKGWCMNTPQGTVVGAMEADKRSFNMMKDWLSRVGSPQSAIERAVFKEERQITHFTFKEFSIKR